MNLKSIAFASRVIATFCATLLAVAARAEGRLTALEEKWIDASIPVLEFAANQGLNVDIVVLPDATTDDVPLSMGVRDGRCKLMLALRGNPDAEATLRDVEPKRHALLIETMAAHEIAHCWRYTQGVWHRLPAGFVEATDSTNAEISSRRAEMLATQREEGFADLVALAWTRRQHPADYADVHAWLVSIRSHQPLSGSYHDTRPWLRLVTNQAAFPADDSCFEQVQSIWAAGLRRAD